jgi:hypothetical protein
MGENTMTNARWNSYTDTTLYTNLDVHGLETTWADEQPAELTEQFLLHCFLTATMWSGHEVDVSDITTSGFACWERDLQNAADDLRACSDARRAEKIYRWAVQYIQEYGYKF